MALYLLIGTDTSARDRALARLKAGLAAPVRVSAADGGAALLRALASRPLFGERRLVIAASGERITPAAARELARLHQDDVVALVADKRLPAAVRRELGEADTVDCALPARKDAAAWVRRTAREHGVRLSGGAVAALADLAPDPVGAARVRDACAMLALVGLTSPSDAQVAALIPGTAAVPLWKITDAIEQGRAGQAVELAAGCEPAAVLAALAARLMKIGLCQETPGPGGGGPGRAAQALAGASRRLPPELVAEATRRVLDLHAQCRGELPAWAAPLRVAGLVAWLADSARTAGAAPAPGAREAMSSR
ncbi:hypothetical protein [Bailinhaonella thermotolerans]|uniref:DNA polymerase III delta N-terminal domain-containing protein n=1 Tax=Bailinhaonella thermotolerans TaxID=1070861 RepID=A0A3A4AEA2_9ACTN|nr:hypothetical protein [Bailinhaonella thermotolerans]RJL23973.1 hypothetical protein D5H75_31565 [Bailinhaonella thermotolerans]